MSDSTFPVWTCKIGTRGTVPVGPGADAPMRRAVEEAFKEITGEWPEFLFSGWGGSLDECELAVVENRMPREALEMNDEQINHMVQRFLAWKLPDNFNPDDGISFEPLFNIEHMARQGKPPMRRYPQGTNLFCAAQAEAMVRHMTEGLPDGS